MTQMTQTIETTPTKTEALINAIQTAEARARELKAGIRAEQTEAAPNYQAITSWRAEVDVIENRQLPTLRGEYDQVLKDSREAELEGLKMQLVKLNERTGKALEDRASTKRQLDDALHAASRTMAGAAWLEVSRLARLFAPIVDESAALGDESKQVSGRIFDMERECEQGRG